MKNQKHKTELSLCSHEILAYCEMRTENEPDTCALIRKAATDHPKSHWITGPIVGSTLQLLIAISNSKQVLDAGTFYGYSAAYMASTNTSVRVTTIDINKQYTDQSERFFANTRLQAQINCQNSSLCDWLHSGSTKFDFVFIDVDKLDIDFKYKSLIDILTPDGILVMDNACMRGNVLNPSKPWHVSVDKFSDLAFSEGAVHSTLLPIRDGLLIVRKGQNRSLV